MSITLLNRTVAVDTDLTAPWLRSMANGLACDMSALISGMGVALASIDVESDGTGDDDEREALALARRNARCMQSLVSDYVELQRFVQRHGGIADELVDVEAMLLEAAREARLDRADVAIECEDGMPAIRGDRRLTVRALAALLGSGAAPHAGDESRPIAIVLHAGRRGDEVEITVRYRTARDAAAAGSQWRSASVVQEFFRTAVTAQGGEARIAPPSARRDLASFTLPAAPEAGEASVAAA